MSGTRAEYETTSTRDGSAASSAQEGASDLSRNLWDQMSKQSRNGNGRSASDNHNSSNSARPAETSGQQAGSTDRRTTGDGARDGEGQRTGDQNRSRGEVITPLAHPNFRGEVIALDVQPTEHVVQQNESLHDIARQHLGQNATERDVRLHVREIQRANGLSGTRLTPENTLVLPGHTASGGYVTASSVDWQNGVPPETYEAQRGETLIDIARNHLGSGATQIEVQNYVQEIWNANMTGDLPDYERLQTLQFQRSTTLHLPGHTVDGQTVDDPAHAPSDRHTVWSNGVERIERQDSQGNLTGVGLVRTPGEGGAYSEHHWGPQSEQNYDLTRNAEGRYLVSMPPGSPPVDRTDANDVRVNRARWNEPAQTAEAGTQRRALRDLIRTAHDGTTAAGTGIMDDATEQRFFRNMSDFESRARENGLSPQEVARTYQQIGRLLQNPDESRVRLASEILDQAAHPTSVNQGDHGTCAVASLESRIYTRHPSEAARLVTDVALTGNYTTRDGTRVEVRNTMLIQNEEIVHEQGDSNRSRASEIFQVAAANIEYQRNGVRSENGALVLIPPQYARYSQDFARPGHNPPDEGDRIIDLRTGHPMVENDGSGRIINSPGLNDNQITDISRQIIGSEDGDRVLANAQRAALGHGYDQSERIASEQQLRETLTRLRQAGQLPTQIIVHAGNEPFFADSGGGLAGGSGGWHVVNVTDFDERTGRVSVDNQWGSGNDRLNGGMDVRDLYLSTLRPGSPEIIAELRRRQAEHPDYMTEIDLLRQRNHAQGRDHISDQEYAQQCSRLLDRLRDDYWNNSISWRQWAEVHVRMVGVLNDLPATQRTALLNPLAPDQREMIQRAEQIVESRRRHAQIGGAAGS